jgi:hypothetical protein
MSQIVKEVLAAKGLPACGGADMTPSSVSSRDRAL